MNRDLVDDYLSLTRKIVKELLAKFGLQDELKGIIDHNYDYKVDRNRLTWKMLIKDDDFKHVSFNSEDKQHFTVSKAIFNNLKGSTYENITRLWITISICSLVNWELQLSNTIMG